MSRLSPEAEELVRAGREALRPSDADRDRLFQVLLPRLGGGTSSGEIDVPTPASAAAKGIIVKISAGARRTRCRGRRAVRRAADGVAAGHIRGARSGGTAAGAACLQRTRTIGGDAAVTGRSGAREHGVAGRPG